MVKIQINNLYITLDDFFIFVLRKKYKNTLERRKRKQKI